MCVRSYDNNDSKVIDLPLKPDYYLPSYFASIREDAFPMPYEMQSLNTKVTRLALNILESSKLTEKINTIRKALSQLIFSEEDLLQLEVLICRAWEESSSIPLNTCFRRAWFEFNQAKTDDQKIPKCLVVLNSLIVQISRTVDTIPDSDWIVANRFIINVHDSLISNTKAIQKYNRAADLIVSWFDSTFTNTVIPTKLCEALLTMRYTTKIEKRKYSRERYLNITLHPLYSHNIEIYNMQRMLKHSLELQKMEPKLIPFPFGTKSSRPL